MPFEHQTLLRERFHLLPCNLPLSDKRIELLIIHRLAIDDRGDVGTHRWSDLHLDDFEALRFHLLLEILQNALLSVLKMFHEALAFILKPFGFERSGDILRQLGQHRTHLIAEYSSLTCRKSDKRRLIGVPEIVDVATVVKSSQFSFELVEETLNRCHASRAGEPGNKDIVTGVFHLQSEPERSLRTLLADDLFRGFYFVGGTHAYQSRAARPAQLNSRNFGRVGTFFSCHERRGGDIPD